jgi:hypothetical protein
MFTRKCIIGNHLEISYSEYRRIYNLGELEFHRDIFGIIYVYFKVFDSIVGVILHSLCFKTRDTKRETNRRLETELNRLVCNGFNNMRFCNKNNIIYCMEIFL